MSVEAAPRVARRTTATAGNFTVILGADYAGKSSILTQLSERGCRCVSYDRDFVAPEHSLINDLRDDFLGRALRGVRRAYSPDLVLTLLQAAVVYLRDQATDSAGRLRTVVDSYYYKILSKCVLKGLGNEDLFAWWRTFPRPLEVLYVDVRPQTAWLRSGCGQHVNSFEYHGDAPTRDGFLAFQRDLRDLMLREVGAVPLTVLPPTADVTAEATRRLVRSTDVVRTGN